MNVVCHGYRKWASRIFFYLPDNNLWKVVPRSIDKSTVHLYYGWSTMIPKIIYSKYLCLILHPSPLPKYRGGSPLQHQIMRGEKKSAVTLLKAGKKLDAGEIYSQTPFSLKGSLDQIFERIIEIGTKDTIKILNKIAKGKLKGKKQDEKKAT